MVCWVALLYTAQAEIKLIDDMAKQAAKPTNTHTSWLGKVTLNDFAGYLLRCVSNIANASYYASVGDSEITPRQFAVLLSLKNYGPLTQSQLSVLTNIDSSTTNEMIARMVKRGLILSGRSKLDRRAIELSLSRAGDETLKRLIKPTIKSQDMVLDALSPKERRIFMNCLVKIITEKKNVFNLRKVAKD